MTKRKPTSRPKASKPSDADLLRAARKLHTLTGAYVDRGFRGQTNVGRMLEPLLRYYLTEYEPEQRRREDQLHHSLASVAWQILMRWQRTESDAKARQADLAKMIAGVQRLRREYDAADQWPADLRVASHQITELLQSPRLPDQKRASRILEVIGEPHFKYEQRGGNRGTRAELLRDAWATASAICAGAVPLDQLGHAEMVDTSSPPNARTVSFAPRKRRRKLT